MLLADTKQKVIDILNASNLPIDAIYYVMKEVMVDVESTYNRVLQEEENAKAQARADAERPDRLSDGGTVPDSGEVVLQRPHH